MLRLRFKKWSTISAFVLVYAASCAMLAQSQMDDRRSMRLRSRNKKASTLRHDLNAMPGPITAATSVSAPLKDTLIFYIFSDTDPAYIDNLRFFVKHGTASATADYVFIVQDQKNTWHEKSVKLGRILANIPAESIVLHHDNDCYDLGTLGWALQHPSVTRRLQAYSYIVMVNSSVRGPFVPPYVPDRKEWHRLLTRRLVNDVRLVGGSISCEGMYSKLYSEHISSPHVQTWLFAIDKKGLQLLQDATFPLQCHKNREDAIIHGELGTSMAILAEGYNIDCLLEPYQGLDWRNWRNHRCNAMKNPMKDANFMGATLHPYATLFTKYKQNQWIEERSGATLDARLIGEWMKDSDKPRVLKRSI